MSHVAMAHSSPARRPASGLRVALSIGLVAVSIPGVAWAQAVPQATLEAQSAAGTAVDAGVLTGRPVVRPPRLAEPPVIDGWLDEALWRDAAHITQLVQRRPFDGIPASEPRDI